MANDEKVFVKSMGTGMIILSLPDLRYRREWSRRGTRLPVPKDILREAIYQPGVEYLFTSGLLYIEDLEFKKELGLEPYDATEPTNVILIDEKMLDRYTTKMPINELKVAIKKLTKEQKKMLAEYVVEHHASVSMDRIDLIEKESGVKILVRINAEKADQENVKEED